MSPYEIVSTVGAYLLLLTAVAGVIWTLYKQSKKEKT